MLVMGLLRVGEWPRCCLCSSPWASCANSRIAPMDRPTPSWPTPRTNAGFRGEVVVPVNEVVWSSKPWTIWRLLGHEAVRHAPLPCFFLCRGAAGKERSASCIMLHGATARTCDHGRAMVDLMPRFPLKLIAIEENAEGMNKEKLQMDMSRFQKVAINEEELDVNDVHSEDVSIHAIPHMKHKSLKHHQCPL